MISPCRLHRNTNHMSSIQDTRGSRTAMPGKTGCAPQKLICHVTDRLLQPQLWLTHQEPITVGDGTRSGCKDRVDISSADGAYQGVLYRSCCPHDPMVLLAETPTEIRE